MFDMSTPRDISRRSFVSRIVGLASAGFGGHASDGGRALNPYPLYMGAAQPPPASSAPIAFRDISTEAGITPVLVCGSPQKKYIVEVNGTGCVWFDYNNDGYVDLYI